MGGCSRHSRCAADGTAGNVERGNSVFSTFLSWGRTKKINKKTPFSGGFFFNSYEFLKKKKDVLFVFAYTQGLLETELD